MTEIAETTEIKTTHKRNKVMTRCNWAIKELQEALGCFIAGSEEEAQRSDENGKWNTYFWRGQIHLEKAQDRLTETMSELSNVDGEVSEEISMWAEYFHTALRKYFDNTSSTVLYKTINLQTHEWSRLLIGLSKTKNKKDSIWATTSLGIYDYINQYLPHDCFELKAAFHYFILENKDCVKTPFRELLGFPKID